MTTEKDTQPPYPEHLVRLRHVLADVRKDGESLSVALARLTVEFFTTPYVPPPDVHASCPRGAAGDLLCAGDATRTPGLPLGLAQALDEVSVEGESPTQCIQRLIAAAKRMRPGPEEDPAKAREVAEVLKLLNNELFVCDYGGLVDTAKRIIAEARCMNDIREALIGVQGEKESTLDTVRRLAKRALTWDGDDYQRGWKAGFASRVPAPENEPGCDCAGMSRVVGENGRMRHFYCANCDPQRVREDRERRKSNISIPPDAPAVSIIAPPAIEPKPLAPWTQEHVAKALADFMKTGDSIAASSAVALVDRMFGRGR